MPQSSELTEEMAENVKIQWGVKISLRDGFCLNATLYRPKHQAAPSPAIFTLTPYIGQTYHDQGMWFAANGYAFLTVDVRGRGDSEGMFRPFIHDAQDGFDVVEWLAQQPYCNGQVAMWGGSYAGLDQWSTAKERPPHLKTIVPAASICIGVDFPMRRNIFWPYVMQWLTFVSGRALQDKIFEDQRYWTRAFQRWFESGASFKALDSFLGNPSGCFQDWVSHPHQSEYWDRYSPTVSDYRNIDVPILTITGIYDNAQRGALRHYREHHKNTTSESHARHYLVIGPWDHSGTRVPKAKFGGMTFGPESLVDLQRLHLEWYAWVMQGGPKPAFLQQRVAYYVTGAERWRYAETLEAVTAESRPLYLDSSGSASEAFASGALRSEPGSGLPDTYLYDPRDITMAAGEAASAAPLCLRPNFPTDDATDQTSVHARHGKQLVYHSASFDCDTEITGFFKLSAWISIDQPDTDFGVAIYEIGIDGGSILLTSDVLRARYRESLREERLVQTAEPLRYEFTDFSLVSRLICRGGRLRLVIGPLNSIHFQKNYNRGGLVAEESPEDARVVTVKVFHDREHLSVLHVPIGTSSNVLQEAPCA